LKLFTDPAIFEVKLFFGKILMIDLVIHHIHPANVRTVFVDGAAVVLQVDANPVTTVK